ncbi:hypothetical protein NW759_013313 [Fusarium solani]|nr:hypothetical protein NW759_013313 [Fusarium solani]
MITFLNGQGEWKIRIDLANLLRQLHASLDWYHRVSLSVPNKQTAPREPTAILKLFQDEKIPFVAGEKLPGPPVLDKAEHQLGAFELGVGSDNERDFMSLPPGLVVAQQGDRKMGKSKHWLFVQLCEMRTLGIDQRVRGCHGADLTGMVEANEKTEIPASTISGRHDASGVNIDICAVTDKAWKIGINPAEEIFDVLNNIVDAGLRCQPVVTTHDDGIVSSCEFEVPRGEEVWEKARPGDEAAAMDAK